MIEWYLHCIPYKTIPGELDTDMIARPLPAVWCDSHIIRAVYWVAGVSLLSKFCRFDIRYNFYRYSEYRIRCKLVHKIINFRSWCTLNFSSK